MANDITGTEDYTNGPYQTPEDTETGNTVFSILQDFMERMATHQHTGADSKEISLNIAKDVEDFTLGVDYSWTDLGNGVYRAQIPVPGTTTYDASIRKFFFDDGGDFNEFYPTVEKIDANNYYVYTNDDTLVLRVITL